MIDVFQSKLFVTPTTARAERRLFAFKPQPDRFLSFFVQGKKIIVATGFIKKSQKLPEKEKDKAVEYRKNYLIRVKEDCYYE